MTSPIVKLTKGIHVQHLFYRIDQRRWSRLDPGKSAKSRSALEAYCATHSAPSHPRVMSFANVGGKADLAFIIFAAELGQLGEMHRDLERCFPAGTLLPSYSYLSVTELPDYVTTEEEMRKRLVEHENLTPESETFARKLSEWRTRQTEYEQYRLYPELPDWEVMAFYPMNKRRNGSDNWYALDFASRKKLMEGHARVGRKFAGRISQLITGSTGIDDWEWGVTLMAHQADSLKEIVYEMRFDEVSARYGEFGPFYINLRLSPEELWQHLRL